jgi:ABC-type phosphonate transport system ATPase subunit
MAKPVIEVRELTRTFGDFTLVDRISFGVYCFRRIES